MADPCGFLQEAGIVSHPETPPARPLKTSGRGAADIFAQLQVNRSVVSMCFMLVVPDKQEKVRSSSSQLGEVEAVALGLVQRKMSRVSHPRFALQHPRCVCPT